MLFFDLDGTLWDATESTARAWSEVFARWGFDSAVSSEQIRSVAGKPYLECLQIIAPGVATLSRLPELLKDMEQAERAWMAKIGGQFYPYVIEGLHELAAVSPLYLVSNCNDWYLQAFLQQPDTQNVFCAAVCHGGTGLPKHENLECLMDSYNISRGYYIGDTNGDRAAAQTAGLTYLHANYGFGGTGVISEPRFDNFELIVRYVENLEIP